MKKLDFSTDCDSITTAYNPRGMYNVIQYQFLEPDLFFSSILDCRFILCVNFPIIISLQYLKSNDDKLIFQAVQISR